MRIHPVLSAVVLGAGLVAGTGSAVAAQEYGPEWQPAQPGPEWAPAQPGPEFQPAQPGPEFQPGADPGLFDSNDILDPIAGWLFR